MRRNKQEVIQITIAARSYRMSPSYYAPPLLHTYRKSVQKNIRTVTVRREMVQIPSLYPGDPVDHLRTTAYEEY